MGEVTASDEARLSLLASSGCGVLHEAMAAGLIKSKYERAVAAAIAALHDDGGVPLQPSCPVGCLGLSSRSYNALRVADGGIAAPATVGDLARLRRTGALGKAEGVGRRTVGEIEARFVFLGLRVERPE